MQDLNGFSVPKGFRGQAVLKCSYGGRFRPPYLPGHRKYFTAGEHFYCVSLAQK